MSSELTVREKIQNSLNQLGGKATKKQILDKLEELYGSINPKTFTAHMYSLSVNVPSRINHTRNNKSRKFNPHYDLMYKIDKNLFEFYNPKKHGDYQLKLVNGSVCVTKDGVAIENDHDLYSYIENMTLKSMNANYKPIVLKSLLEAKNYTLSVKEIEKNISELNFDRKKFNLKYAIDSVSGALNNFVKITGDSWSLFEENFDDSEIQLMLQKCGKLIGKWHIREILQNEPTLWRIKPGKEDDENEFPFADEFLKTKTFGIGWNSLSDLSKFNDENQLFDFINSFNSEDLNKSKPAANIICFRMKIKDLVICTKAQQEIVDYGIITGDYFYDPSGTYEHRRKVVWLNQGPISKDELPPGTLSGAIKTLQKVDTKKQSLIELLIGEDLRQRMANTSDLGFSPIQKLLDKKKNVIIYGPPGTGKTLHVTEIAKNYQSNESDKKFFMLMGPYTNWERSLSLDKPLWGTTDDPGNVGNYKQMQVGDYVILKVQKNDMGPFSNNGYFGIGKITRLFERSEPFWSDEISSNKVIWNHTLEFEIIHKTDSPIPSIPGLPGNKGLSVIKESPILNSILEKITSEWGVEFSTPRYKMVTFHPSYSYEDFIEGIRPEIVEEEDDDYDSKQNSIRYKLHDGVFKSLVDKAKKDPKNNYLLIIDEINRGNISKIFGELITLIEDDKRGKLPITLAYSQEPFSVPDNLYILGTMNTADKSLIQIDTALRRRFAFFEMMPDSSHVTQLVGKISVAKLMDSLNEKIRNKNLRDKQIGHSYFMKIDSIEKLQFVFKYEIIPLLQDYFYEDYLKLSEILGEKIISKEKMEVNNKTIDNPDNFIDALGYILGKDNGNNSSGI